MATRIQTTYRPTQLLKARDLIVEGWLKGDSHYFNPEVGVDQYCMTGAMVKAKCQADDYVALASIIDPGFDKSNGNGYPNPKDFAFDLIIGFNDKKETHLEDLLRVVNQAIRTRQTQLSVAGRRAARKALATKTRTTAKKARKS